MRVRFTVALPVTGGMGAIGAAIGAAATAVFVARLARRLARAYGSRIAQVLGGAASRADLGEEIAPGLFEAELRYLRREEWACTAEDVLWRRTKRGLHFSEAQRQRVADWMNQADEHRKVA